MSGILLGKTMGRSAELAERFEGESNRLADLEVRSRMTGRWLMQSIQMTFAIMPALIYWFGGLEVQQRTAPRPRTPSIGTLVAFTTLQTRLFAPIGSLLSISVDVQSSLALFDRIFEYLDLPVDIAPGHADARARFAATCGSTTSGSATATGPTRSRRSTSRSRPGRRPRSSARPAPARRRSATSSRGSTTRRKGRVTIDGIDIRDLTFESLAVDGRRRLAGDLSLPRDRAREPALREARRDRRGGRGGGARRADPRADLVAARGLRDRRRRARLPLLGRREAADGDRARDPAQPADPRARRGDLGARHADRARRPGGARTGSSKGARRSRSPTGSRPSATPTRSSSSTTAASSRPGTYDELVALGGRFAALAARDFDSLDGSGELAEVV